jgi:iron(III) transport system substrate-binding protein
METEFEKANPAIDVQWADMGSQEILDRLRAESVNPGADVWFGAPAEAFDRAAKEGLLEPYKPTWSDAVDPTSHDTKDLWYGTYLTPEVIAYNTDAVSAEEAPKDWDDVLDPKWRDKVLIRDPVASGTMRAIFGALIAREAARTGTVDSGYAWLRRLDANTREYVLNPTILYQKLGRREGVITLWDMPDIATLKERLKLPVAYVIPTSGTPLLVDAIAIVKGTEHRKEAELYYEFVTNKTSLIVSAVKYLRIPTRKDIPDDSLPGWIREARTTIKPMQVDRALMSRSLDDWMKYWDAHIRNSARDR